MIFSIFNFFLKVKFLLSSKLYFRQAFRFENKNKEYTMSNFVLKLEVLHTLHTLVGF